MSTVKDTGTGELKVQFPFVLEDGTPGWGRISTKTQAGSAVVIPVGYPYGEGVELRYTCAFTASQFQGLFIQVAAASGVANTSTIRGAELSARSASGQAAGTLEGLNAAAFKRGTGTVTSAYGVTGEVQMDDVAGTITTLAALRGKIQSGSSMTLTNGYGILIENEFISGAKTLDAVLRAQATGGGAGFEMGFDISGTSLATVDTNKVTLIKFKDQAGVTKELRVDTSGTVTVA